MADFSTWFLWMLSSINATTVNRGVIQATPGTPVWEEIEDIFRNYYIDMRIIYMVLTWLWIWQFDCYQVGIISIVLQWLRHIGRSRNTISFRFFIACALTYGPFYFRPPPPPPHVSTLGTASTPTHTPKVTTHSAVVTSSSLRQYRSY